MILADSEIRRALEIRDLIVEPAPQGDQFSPSALDLHVGADFRRFRPELYRAPGVDLIIRLDSVELQHLRAYLEQLAVQPDGSVILRPGELVIATTLEHIELPARGRLAARVEGRSRFARLGLVIHMTAPTIHSTFRGNITLEMMNHGPIPLLVTPNRTRICQLIFERLEGEASSTLSSPFQDQTTPLGSS